MKAQTAIEYVIIVITVLLIITPLYYFASISSKEELAKNKAEDAVRTLSATAEQIYTLGPGSKRFVFVDIPESIADSKIEENKIILTISHKGEYIDILQKTTVNIEGNLPKKGGTYKIFVEKISNDTVYIGEVLDLSPPKIIEKGPEGTINYNHVTMFAKTDKLATCKYDIYDRNYNDMQYDFAGIEEQHSKNLGKLENGDYLYYARCLGRNGVAMPYSEIISFTVSTTEWEWYLLDRWSDDSIEKNLQFPLLERGFHVLYLALPMNTTNITEAYFSTEGKIK